MIEVRFFGVNVDLMMWFKMVDMVDVIVLIFIDIVVWCFGVLCGFFIFGLIVGLMMGMLLG